MSDLISAEVQVSGSGLWFATLLHRFRAGGGGRAWLARVAFILVFALLFASAGCDVLTFERTDFPDAFVGADGEEVLLDDVAAIVNDTTLDADQKREALRDLGIEDEDVIDAVLAG